MTLVTLLSKAFRLLLVVSLTSYFCHYCRKSWDKYAAETVGTSKSETSKVSFR